LMLIVLQQTASLMRPRLVQLEKIN
jgi:hypothetical protein